jgi:GT2 family glycosyltransferase
MSIDNPTVSIALPVFNGENYLRVAIGSVFGQSFEDFELLLLDNASTDATEEICRAAVAQDRRVRYFRAKANGGLAWNHNRAVELATGRYLMWTAHDDALGEDYVRRCVEALDQNPDAVLAFANTQLIDANGERLGQFSNHCDNTSPSSRFRSLMRGQTCCDAVFGLMRMETLKQTGLHGYFAGSDLVLLGELALHGRFIVIPEFCYLRRHHPHVTSSPARTSREITLIFDPQRAGKVFVPYFLTAGGFLAAIRRARPPWKDRFICYKDLSIWLWANRRDLYYDCVGPVTGALKRHLSEDSVARLKSLRNWLLRRASGKKTVTSNS